MCPVIAFEWLMMGHLYIWTPLIWAGTIAAESVYTITLDQFAISRGIWHIYPGTGLRLPVSLFGNSGIQIEQVLVYSMTTVMIVSMLQPFLVMMQYWLQAARPEPFWRFAARMLCSDAELPPAPKAAPDLEGADSAETPRP
eukprot:TRINITY_DN13505_c0_g1_i2.p4 TRINITY_DN13505_c0_g1~~TRINITY_DN13505_c0_g1_i2.p4  ORF type:complete len:141 (+),score=43.41 TRINITY_DN13505_c0_g1_i2:802-1224(+)